MAHCHTPARREKLIRAAVVKTFLRELEKVLARMGVAERRRASEILRGLIDGLAHFKEAVPGLPPKAIAALIADLTMYMSMGKKGPAVFEKAKAIAVEVGPHVDALVNSLAGVRAN